MSDFIQGPPEGSTVDPLPGMEKKPLIRTFETAADQ
jgi:hypothetical protein